MKQEQFLNVVNLETAHRKFSNAVGSINYGEELVRVEAALGRVLTRPVAAPINVPAFDRSNFDGFAVIASDTVGADEINQRTLIVLPDRVPAGARPTVEIFNGHCVEISTGAMLPRGANAVLMIEHTDTSSESDNSILVSKAISPGEGISFCGNDIAVGENVVSVGRPLTNRETTVLASLGIDRVHVRKRPQIAIISTGNELVSPGTALAVGEVFDANSRMLSDRIREMGAHPIELGIVRDDYEQLHAKIAHALEIADIVLLSGGTSKGQGDLCYRAIKHWEDPGIIVHGVAIKPGKPVCLAVTRNKPVAILPGFPASARFTFDEFIAPLIRKWTGAHASQVSIPATLQSKINSAPGRTEYVQVGMLRNDSLDKKSETLRKRGQYIALPLSRDSGSVSTYAKADGYIRIAANREFVQTGETVDVVPIMPEQEFADLIIVGSHCVHVDQMLELCESNGIRTRYFHVGSTGGLLAAQTGACDIATLHLKDRDSGIYNKPFVDDSMELIPGYPRKQGFVFRKDDKRFVNLTANKIVETVTADPSCLMINRNAGSGTRVLIDQLLDGGQPKGYFNTSSSHTAVVSSIEQNRADWGIAIEAIAGMYNDIAFVPVEDEQFDFLVPKSRMNRKAVRAFLKVLDLYGQTLKK